MLLILAVDHENWSDEFTLAKGTRLDWNKVLYGEHRESEGLGNEPFPKNLYVVYSQSRYYDERNAECGRDQLLEWMKTRSLTKLVKFIHRIVK